MHHRRYWGLVVAVLTLWGAGVVAPITPAQAATALSAPASLTGLAPGGYRLHATVTSTTGGNIPGALVQQVAGQGRLLRVATFTVTPSGVDVSAGVRSTAPTDLFMILTLGTSSSTALTATPATLGTVARGTSLIGPDGAALTLHGVNSDPWMTPTDVVGLHNTTPANVVRIPVSECFWLPWSASYDPTYRDKITQLVNATTTNGMMAIIVLQWACHDDPNWKQTNYNAYNQVGPDQHSITFWQDVASTFKTNSSVMFELFNEPQMVLGSYYNGRTGQDVWLYGGRLSYGLWRWNAPGMQQLYDTVRATGADNVVLADGMEWASDLRMLMMGYGVKGANVAYAYHAYTHDGQNPGAHTPYLDTMVWPSIDPNGRWAYAAAATEFGTAARDNALLQTGTSYFEDTLFWLDTHGQSWAVWGWYPTTNDAYGLLTARPSTVTNRGLPVLQDF